MFKKIILMFTFTITLVLLLNACSTKGNNINPDVKSNSPTAIDDNSGDNSPDEGEKVIRKYFDSINNQDYEAYLSTMTESWRSTNFVYFKDEFDAKVIKITKLEGEKAERQENSYRKYGAGKRLKPYKVQIYDVAYSLKRKRWDDNTVVENIDRHDYFILVKIKEDSNWEISDIGV